MSNWKCAEFTDDLGEKREWLRKRLTELATDGDLCVAFSGGVDSALLLAMTIEVSKSVGNQVYAVTFSTKLHSMGDMEAAQRVSKELGAIHKIIEVDELAQEEIRNNPRNRCYLCKKSLFLELKRFAEEVGAAYCLEGTNGDDLHSWRPGLQALRELDIKSPLAELGITKVEVRGLAKEYGLSAAHRPSSPCMATRLPYGTALDHELLRRIDGAESGLRVWLGGNVRLRVHGDVARIEVDKEHLGRAVALADEIVSKCKEYGFHYVTLDLEGFRSGSMDE